MMRRLIRDIAVVVLATWTICGTLLRRLLSGPKHPRWGLRFELVVEVMRAVLRLGHDYMSPAMRRKQPAPMLPRGLASRVRKEQDTVAGVPVEALTPIDWKPGDPTWLHFHGGAYSMCSPATHRVLLGRIALASGARCVTPNYRKAPEHPYPAPIDDCYDVYRALLEQGVDNLIMGGDSAGGGLALAVMQRARAEGLLMPRTAVLLSPWVDLTATSGGTIETNRSYDYLAGEMLVSARQDYLAGAAPQEPEASAVYADLTGLPPLLVQSGGAEIFLDQNRHLVDRAREHGVHVIHEISEGMVHVFQILDPFRPAREAVRSIGRHVAEHADSQVAAE